MSSLPTAATSTSDIVQFLKTVADETRLTIVRVLAMTDLKAGEIMERVGAPQNAVSYHLKQLRLLGLLHDRRSNGDARDVYYSIDVERLQALYAATGTALHPGLAAENDFSYPARQIDRPLRVLFLCTHNSARSQLAEAILRYLGGDQVEVYSAGSQPSDLHPMARQLLEEWGIDTSQFVSKPMSQFTGQQFDYVITVCDRIRDSCPTFPGDPERIHWSFPDPSIIGDEAERWQAFLKLRRELCSRIRLLLSMPHPATGQRFHIHPKTHNTGAV